MSRGRDISDVTAVSRSKQPTITVSVRSSSLCRPAIRNTVFFGGRNILLTPPLFVASGEGVITGAGVAFAVGPPIDLSVIFRYV